MGDHDRLHDIYDEDFFAPKAIMGEKRCRTLVTGRADALGEGVCCERCGSMSACTLHHRRKRSQLPRHRFWEPSNCVMLCGDGTHGCHGWVEHNPDDARLEGFHVRAYEESRSIPVKLWHQEDLMYLRDTGGYGLLPG